MWFAAAVVFFSELSHFLGSLGIKLRSGNQATLSKLWNNVISWISIPSFLQRPQGTMQISDGIWIHYPIPACRTLEFSVISTYLRALYLLLYGSCKRSGPWFHSLLPSHILSSPGHHRSSCLLNILTRLPHVRNRFRVLLPRVRLPSV